MRQQPSSRQPMLQCQRFAWYFLEIKRIPATRIGGRQEADKRKHSAFYLTEVCSALRHNFWRQDLCRANESYNSDGLHIRSACFAHAQCFKIDCSAKLCRPGHARNNPQLTLEDVMMGPFPLQLPITRQSVTPGCSS